MPVTLRDIAKRLNLSHATVSFVLNDRRDVAIPETTRRRVLEMANEMGYRPNRAARALVMGRTNILGVWMPSVRHHFYAEVLDELSIESRRLGYETLYHRAEFDESDRRPFDWPIDGMLAVDVADLVREVPSIDIPMVAVGAFVDERLDAVVVDLHAGAEAAVDHLAEVAGRRVAFVKVNPRRDGRDTGYEAALNRIGGVPEVIQSEGTSTTRIQAAVREHVRRRGMPDGFFAANDLTAISVQKGLASEGYFPPRDYVIAGFDGIADTETSSLTTVVQPVQELAANAIGMLIRRIRDPQLPRQYRLLAPKLEVRDSSRRLIRIAETA
jgi:LacI family transcriptional regulator